LDEFDEALLNAIDSILRFALGDACTQIICHYLERTSFPKSEISKRFGRFSEELKNLWGDGRGQILGSAPILEETIAGRICAELGTKLQGELQVAFSTSIRKYKEDYYLSAQENVISVSELTAKTKKAKIQKQIPAW